MGDQEKWVNSLAVFLAPLYRKERSSLMEKLKEVDMPNDVFKLIKTIVIDPRLNAFPWLPRLDFIEQSLMALDQMFPRIMEHIRAIDDGSIRRVGTTPFPIDPANTKQRDMNLITTFLKHRNIPVLSLNLMIRLGSSGKSGKRQEALVFLTDNMDASERKKPDFVNGHENEAFAWREFSKETKQFDSIFIASNLYTIADDNSWNIPKIDPDSETLVRKFIAPETAPSRLSSDAKTDEPPEPTQEQPARTSSARRRFSPATPRHMFDDPPEDIERQRTLAYAWNSLNYHDPSPPAQRRRTERSPNPFDSTG